MNSLGQTKLFCLLIVGSFNFAHNCYRSTSLEIDGVSMHYIPYPLQRWPSNDLIPKIVIIKRHLVRFVYVSNVEMPKLESQRQCKIEEEKRN